MSRFSTLVCFATVFLAASSAAFAGVAVTPEPKLGILTALGVGAVVLVARKVKKR
jgi:hypothetical protein